MKTLTIFSVLFLFTISCKKKDNINFFQNNMDSYDMYLNVDNLTNKHAQSGKYASVVNASHPWSFGFKRTLSDLNQPAGKKVTFTASIFFEKKPIDTQIAISILGKNLFWDAKNILTPKMVPNTWYKVTIISRLPKLLNPDDELRTFVTTNQPQDEVWVDDIELEIE